MCGLVVAAVRSVACLVAAASLATVPIVLDPGPPAWASGQEESEAEEPQIVLQLAFQDVYAEPGEEVSFDASQSFDTGGEALTFEWDLDGDGAVDEVTTNGLATHVYDEPFEGTGELRVVTPDGREAHATLTLHIAPEKELLERYHRPDPPRSVLVGRPDAGTILVTWEPPEVRDATIGGYLIRIFDDEGDVLMFHPAGPDATSAEATGVPDEAASLSIAAASELDRYSEPVDVELPAVGEEASALGFPGGTGSRVWLTAVVPTAIGAAVVAAAAWLVLHRRLRRPESRSSSPS